MGGPVIYLGSALLVIGILFSPFAALKCARVAEDKGLSMWRYALVGGLFSIALLLPWMYLIRRMQGTQVSYKSIRWSYLALYIFWLLLLITHPIGTPDWHVETRIEFTWTYFSSNWADFPDAVKNTLLAWVAILLFSAITFAISLIVLWRRSSVKNYDPENQRHDELPRFVYIMPFVCVSVHVIGTFIATAVVGFVWYFSIYQSLELIL